ncbi:hypothetical protein BRD09_04510 [Halobacteriales archaeon SW_10_68_16]|nr:MAG: hypothetical protein BRD09_04510 [Halobacteriales archaeon SW_10_68_16]
MLYATRGLVQSLLRLAGERDPDGTTIPLAVTPAEDLSEADLTAETPVFTHFYMPDSGGAVSAVFGVDMGTPAGQTQGRFVSHPEGDLRLSTRDDLHEVVFVAVPPYDEESLAAFDRSGREQDFTVLDVEPPEERPGL